MRNTEANFEFIHIYLTSYELRFKMKIDKDDDIMNSLRVRETPYLNSAQARAPAQRRVSLLFV